LVQKVKEEKKAMEKVQEGGGKGLSDKKRVRVKKPDYEGNNDEYEQGLLYEISL
jgi:hypothetical protein